MGLFRRKKKQVLAKAFANWHEGVFFTSPQRTGTITAYPERLEAEPYLLDSSFIDWKYFTSFGLIDEDYKFVLNAGAPLNWLFVVSCVTAEDRVKWRQILKDKGVVESESFDAG